MKKIIFLMLICVLYLSSGCSQTDKTVIPTTGKYYLEKIGSSSFIEVADNNKLLFYDIDFSDIEKNIYEKWEISLISKEGKNADVTLSDDENELKIQTIRDEIDLDKQFSGQFSQFEFIEEAGEYGFMTQVNGSSLWLTVLYQPEDNSLIFNEHKYILMQGDAK